MQVMNEAHFASVWTCERKRADRASRPFVVVRVELRDRPGPRPPALWDTVIEALAATKDDTDVLGWFRWQQTLGMIVADLGGSDVAMTQVGVEAEVRRQLAKRLDTAGMASVALQVQAYPAQASEVPGATMSDGIKRAVDLVGGLALLLLLVPVMLAIAVLVKLWSPGPVLFKQVRIGYMNRPFTMLKFRTMHVNVDPQLHRDFVSAFIAGAGGAARPADGVFKLANDPRVTAIGRILRKTSLDELPQLWNVVRGDMSLVGPRPPIPYELAQYKGWHRRRLFEAKPGITGLWQVAGRSRTTFDDMVRLDLRYARSRSLWMDVKLLLATPAAVISGKGAC